MSDLAADVERVLHDQRHGHKVGREIKFQCPSHDDESPTAEWNRQKQAWNCPACGAGGTTTSLAELLGLAVEKPRDRAEKATIVATYDYRDEQGVLLYQAVRRQPKSFSQRRPDGNGGWINNLEGTRLVPYRLPELLASSGRVYLPEGEKDADTLIERGLVASCNAMGAGKWRKPYNAHFAGREVVLLADNDKAGEEHVAKVAASLYGTAATIKILRLPDLPPKGDVSDWLFLGGDVASLEELADACPVWEPPSAEPAGAGSPAHYATTDSGNAELFAELNGHRVRFDHRLKRWLVYDRHRWVPEGTGELIRWAIEAARVRARASADLPEERAKASFAWAKASESASAISAMLKIAQALPPISDPGLGWDANPMLLGCENGIVNLVTGELRPGRPDDRITRTTGLAYDPAAQCPRWERFMVEIQPDEKVREYLRIALGYSATGSTKEQVWFLCHGPTGANGKGVTFQLCRQALGEYAAVMMFSTIEKGKDVGAATPDMAALYGKRFATMSETEEYTQVNEARIKSLTGEDPITARELYSKQFTFEPEVKLWLAFNSRPKVSDNTSAYWRRVRLFPFEVSFEDPAVRDDNLKATLRKELQGILAWLVRAAIDWARSGLPPIPPAVAVAVVEYRALSDPLGDFITERCVVREDAVTGADALYKEYRGYAEAKMLNQREMMSSTSFGRRMSDRFDKRQINGRNQYRGIGLISDGWEHSASSNPLPSRGLLDTGEGLLGVTNPGARSRMSDFALDPLPTLYPLPSGGATACGACGDHSDPKACEDEDWWQDEFTVWHCGRHHPIPA